MVRPSKTAERGLDPVDDVFDARFLGDDAAFVIDAVIAIEAGGDPSDRSSALGSRSPANCSIVN